MSITFTAYVAPTATLNGGFGEPGGLFTSGTPVDLRGRFAPPTGAFTSAAPHQSGALSGTFGAPTALLWSGDLLRGEFAPATSAFAEGPAMGAAVLSGSVPVPQWLASFGAGSFSTSLYMKPLVRGLFTQTGVSALRGEFAAPSGSFTPAITVLNYIGMRPRSYLSVSAAGTPAYLAASTMRLSLSQIVTATQVIVDILTMSDSYSTLFSILEQLQSGLTMADIVDALLRLDLADSASFSSSPVSSLQYLLVLMDYLDMQSGLNATAQVTQLIASILALRDVIDNSQWQSLASTAAVSGALLDSVTAYSMLLDSLRVAAVPAGSALLVAYITSGLQLTDSMSAIAQILAALYDNAFFSLTLSTGTDLYTAWVMTPENKAMRSYSNFPFNSFAQIGDQFLGASALGVYQFGGVTDAGAAITAAVRTGLLDFGTRKLKRIDTSYIGFTSTGTLCLRVCATTNTGSKEEYTYRMVPVPNASAATQTRAKVGRGVESVYWSFELDNNLDGSTFELYDITVLPMALTGRIN